MITLGDFPKTGHANPHIRVDKMPFSVNFRTTAHGYTNWFKFDDGDVSDCKMDDDEVPYYVIFVLQVFSLHGKSIFARFRFYGEKLGAHVVMRVPVHYNSVGLP